MWRAPFETAAEKMRRPQGERFIFLFEERIFPLTLRRRRPFRRRLEGCALGKTPA